jgi:hypothetical protein
MTAVSVSKTNVRIVTTMLAIVVGFLLAYLLVKIIFGNWVFNIASMYTLVGCLGVIFGTLGVIYFGSLAVRAVLDLREDFGSASGCAGPRSNSYLVMVVLVLAFVSLSVLAVTVAASPEIESVNNASSVAPISIDCPAPMKSVSDLHGIPSDVCLVVIP